MHKFMLKLFEFLKNCAQFIKIVALFLVLMLLLYWIKNLAGYSWTWLNFVAPLFDFLLEGAERVSNVSINLFAAVFEFKYFIVLIMLGTLYAIGHFAEFATQSAEDMYCEGRKIVRKIEEDMFNKSLEEKNSSEQTKIKRYQIYVETSVKPKYAHKEYNVNLDEQNQLMNKFIISKTGVCPQKYESGFLYTFESFNKIDRVLDVFERLPKSKAPIDYLTCVQILGVDAKREMQQLKQLISLKFLNKITTLSDTVFRYSYNIEQGYETSQLGIFQWGKGTFEVHQFVKKG